MVETEKPVFSVVVPTYERPADLMICLESLSYKNQVDAPSYEIIVSDDSKSDTSKFLMRKIFLMFIGEKEKKLDLQEIEMLGSTEQQVNGLYFLDDDCIAQKGYLAAYATAIAENPDVLVFEGRIFADRPRKTWTEGCPENEHGGMLWTSNLCVNRKLYNEMDGLDERFKIAYEDVDFATRLRKQKIEGKFVPNASVCHPWRTLKQEGNNWKRKGYQFQELLIFLEKHPDQFKYHNPKIFVRHAIRAICKEIPLGFINFRGRGTIFKIVKTIHSLKVALLLINFWFSHPFSYR